MSCPTSSCAAAESASSSVSTPISGTSLLPFTGGSGSGGIDNHETPAGSAVYSGGGGGGKKRNARKSKNKLKKRHSKRRTKAKKTKGFRRYMRMSRKRRMSRRNKKSIYSNKKRMYGGAMGVSGLPMPSVNALTQSDFGSGSSMMDGIVGSQSPMYGGNVYKHNTDSSMHVKGF